jgi:hypothetical protein
LDYTGVKNAEQFSTSPETGVLPYSGSMAHPAEVFHIRSAIFVAVPYRLYTHRDSKIGF